MRARVGSIVVAAAGLLAFFAAAAMALSAGQSDRAVRSLAIVHVAVVDTERGATVPDITVVIRNGRIASVDSHAVVPKGAALVDGRNKFLMPGLWDMHMHLSYARASALPALVANGVTSVRDLGSDLSEIDRWRAQISDGVLVGPEIVRAGPILNGREFNAYQLAIADAADARMAVRTLRKAGVDFIKMHRQTSREAYLAAADEARAVGLPFGGHVPVTMTPAEVSDARPASIEHTMTLFEGTFADAHAGEELAAAIARWRSTDADALFARFVRNATPVDATLVALEHVVREFETGAPDPRDRYIAASARVEGDQVLRAATPDRTAYARENRPLLRELELVTGQMHRAGVTLLAGTDTSFLHPPGFSLHDELALLVRSGLRPADALRAATFNPAQLFPSQQAGVVATGKRADLVLLDGNPLDDIRNADRLAGVVLRGRYFDRSALDGLLRDAARLAAVN